MNMKILMWTVYYPEKFFCYFTFHLGLLVVMSNLKMHYVCVVFYIRALYNGTVVTDN